MELIWIFGTTSTGPSWMEMVGGEDPGEVGQGGSRRLVSVRGCPLGRHRVDIVVAPADTVLQELIWTGVDTVLRLRLEA